MKLNRLVASLVATFSLGFAVAAPEPGASPEPTAADALAVPTLAVSPAATAAPDVTEQLDRQLRDRESNILRLNIDEQLRLRAVQQKAINDPAVKEAAEKRNRAVEEFRLQFREAMIKMDPGIQPILDRIAVGNTPGF